MTDMLLVPFFKQKCDSQQMTKKEISTVLADPYCYDILRDRLHTYV